MAGYKDYIGDTRPAPTPEDPWRNSKGEALDMNNHDCGQTAQQQTVGIAGRAYREPSLRDQLSKGVAQYADDHAKISRALDILQRHPEFEEFLELQRLLKGTLYGF